MKIGTIILETAAILGLAAAAGTAYHLAFQPPEKRIEFIKSYPNPFTPKPREEKGAPAPVVAKAAVAPLPAPAPVPAKPPVPAPAATPPAAVTASPAPAATPPVLAEKPRTIVEIGLDEGKADFDQEVPFLDARRTRDFQKSRIKGARSLSVWEPGNDGRIAEASREVPVESPVVVYCNGGNCEDSHNLAKDLESFGYKEIRILKDGITGWEKKGYPVEKDAAAGTEEPEAEEEGR